MVEPVKKADSMDRTLRCRNCSGVLDEAGWCESCSRRRVRLLSLLGCIGYTFLCFSACISPFVLFLRGQKELGAGIMIFAYGPLILGLLISLIHIVIKLVRR